MASQFGPVQMKSKSFLVLGAVEQHPCLLASRESKIIKQVGKYQVVGKMGGAGTSLVAERNAPGDREEPVMWERAGDCHPKSWRS